MSRILNEYEVYKNSIILYLTDMNNNEEIGIIWISEFGVFICENSSNVAVNEKKMKKQLYEEFKLLFKEECNPISSKYYQKILSMIDSGELSSLGYVRKNNSKEYNFQRISKR